MGKYQTRISIMILWTGSLVYPQQVPSPPPSTAPAAAAQTALSLPQATAIALQSHPQIAVARNTAASAGQRIIESRAAYYPVLDGEVTNVNTGPGLCSGRATGWEGVAGAGGRV